MKNEWENEERMKKKWRKNEWENEEKMNYLVNEWIINYSEHIFNYKWVMNHEKGEEKNHGKGEEKGVTVE